MSVWVGTVGDTQIATRLAARYTENFDGSDYTIGQFFQLGAIDQCWNRDVGVNYAWTPEDNVTTFSSGPSSDHTTGSGQFLYSARFFGGNPAQVLTTSVYSPLINLSPLNTPELTFWYHMFGGDIDSLVVDVFDGNGWTNVNNLVGPQQTVKPKPGKRRWSISVPLPMTL
ncbi:MAG: hypothetical protein U5L96_04740 [Owenweeksia sp.]|nr:hypothetical protein [Owenweeksia sp.]